MCADRSGSLLFSLHTKRQTREIHAGHALRWRESAGEIPVEEEKEDASTSEATAHKWDKQAVKLAQCANGKRAPLLNTPAELLMNSISSCNRHAMPWLPLAAADGSDDGGRGPHEGGPALMQFLSTLQPVGSVPPAAVESKSLPIANWLSKSSPEAASKARKQNVFCAAAHPVRPLYATAGEDQFVHIWSFGDTSRVCVLSCGGGGAEDVRESSSLQRQSSEAVATADAVAGTSATTSESTPSPLSPKRNEATTASSAAFVAGAATSVAGAAGGAAAAVAGAAQGVAGGAAVAVGDAVGAAIGPQQLRGEGACRALAWSQTDDRLMAVSYRSRVCLWSLGGLGARTTPYMAFTGAAQAKTLCGIFVSSRNVVATGGRRAESDSGNVVQKWPYTSAGLCLWDTLAAPHQCLVGHDGNSERTHEMPAEYQCLALAPDQRRILCGMKSGEVRVFDVRNHDISHRLNAHEASCSHCFVLPETNRLVTLSTAAEAKIWSLQDFSCLETIPRLHGHRGVGGVLGTANALSSAAMLSSNHLLTAGHDGTVLLTLL
eukprot:gnl/MRDRNA2_/MRDRNA2_62928_c0_seq1.p1 gnl/MRDRNA2_/MRDRNA2_62928_c0~~gnl/MRDRNA2_/MRDRNA2_62928_c0_seq1.p1  ORF type:complete len:548 (-),score=91.23 gnl/MRDRNA2_/MRDRNA2_62928_c0_seq1:47-1690(-)